MAKETSLERAKRLNANKLITKRKTKPTVKSGMTGAKRTRNVDRGSYTDKLTSTSANSLKLNKIGQLPTQITSSKLKKIAAMRQKNEITLKDAIDMIAPNNATQEVKVAIAGMLGTARPSAASKAMAIAKKKEMAKKRKSPMALAKAANKKAATPNKKK